MGYAVATSDDSYSVTADGDSYSVGEVAYIDANDYGFLPTSTASENVAAFGDIPQGQRIVILTPGTYEINGTLWLESNTTLVFCSGCTMKPLDSDTYTHTFANKGILTEARNSNIAIYGNGLIMDVALHDNYQAAVGYRMKGHINFFRMDGLVLDDIYTENINGNQFLIHFGDVHDFTVSNITGICVKDIIHFNGLVTDGTLTDFYSDTPQNAFALMATDWYGGTPVVGDINNIIVTRWTDETIVYTENETAATLRFDPCSWAVWETGNQYTMGSVCVNNGQTYMSATPHYQIGTVAPVHTTGDVEGGDGITWTWLQEGTATEGNLENISFIDCVFKNKGMVFHNESASVEDDTLEFIYPGTQGNAYCDNIVFDNLTWIPYNGNIFWNSSNYTKSITFKNTTLTPVADGALMKFNYAGTSDQRYQAWINEINIENCNFTFGVGQSIVSKLSESTLTDINIIDSVIDSSSKVLLDLDVPEHVNINLTDTEIIGMDQLIYEAHYWDVDINANGCTFTDPVNILYHKTAGSTEINFIADGCTFTESIGLFLFVSDQDGLTIDIDNSTGAITQTKILDVRTSFLTCDLLTEDGVGANLIVNGGFDSDLSGWTIAETPPNIVEWVDGEAHIKRTVSNDTSIRQMVLEVGKTYRSIVETTLTSGLLALEFGTALGATYNGKHLNYVECVGNTRSGVRAFNNSSEGYVDSVIVQEVL